MAKSYVTHEKTRAHVYHTGGPLDLLVESVDSTRVGAMPEVINAPLEASEEEQEEERRTEYVSNSRPAETDKPAKPKDNSTIQIDLTRDLEVAYDSIDRGEPLFRYFLDGSRHVIKLDDFIHNGRLYPVLAGQITVACLERTNGTMRACSLNQGTDASTRQIVLAIPRTVIRGTSDKQVNQHLEEYRVALNNHAKLRKLGVCVHKILPYIVENKRGVRHDNKAVATIQNYMAQSEQECVQKLVENEIVKGERWALKDGSLQYYVLNDVNRNVNRLRNNYQYVIGASKTFYSALYNTDGRSTPMARQLRELKPMCRTAAIRLHSTNNNQIHYCIWYVRLREARALLSPYDGVIKLERLYATDPEMRDGVNSALINRISAHLLAERCPTCYGADARWANHLYPIYLAEQYAKSLYLSNQIFQSLF